MTTLPNIAPALALLLGCLLFPGCEAGRAAGKPLPPTGTGPEPHAPEPQKKTPKQPQKKPAPVLENFTQKVPDSDIQFDMVAIPGGTFRMGSPVTEKGRSKDEGPQHQVTISPFWMGKCEVRWDEYDLWSKSDGKVDGVTRPTPPYVDMTFGMGRDDYPAICMTQLAARTYCEWLSKVTGRRYRLPTEAEWEYACRAGTSTAYSFGDDASKLGAFGWFEDNSDEEYHQVGKKKPNPWGLYDMHGNVAEWCQDQHKPYTKNPQKDPLVAPKTLYPRIARGGGWSQTAAECRAAKRIQSDEDWKEQDPQVPKSIWYHTDADFVGFRVVCEFDPKTGKAAKYRPRSQPSKKPAK